LSITGARINTVQGTDLVEIIIFRGYRTQLELFFWKKVLALNASTENR
jgi:hypothetical protein